MSSFRPSCLNPPVKSFCILTRSLIFCCCIWVLRYCGLVKYWCNFSNTWLSPFFIMDSIWITCSFDRLLNPMACHNTFALSALRTLLFEASEVCMCVTVLVFLLVPFLDSRSSLDALSIVFWVELNISAYFLLPSWSRRSSISSPLSLTLAAYSAASFSSLIWTFRLEGWVWAPATSSWWAWPWLSPKV